MSTPEPPPYPAGDDANEPADNEGAAEPEPDVEIEVERVTDETTVRRPRTRRRQPVAA